MVYFPRAVLEFPFSVTQCIIYEMEKESMVFSGLSLQEKRWWGWEEYLPCILRWIILEGHDRMEGQRDGQVNI